MLHRDLEAFIRDTEINIEGHGQFKFSCIKNFLGVNSDEYHLVYGITPDDHPTFMVFHANGKDVIKAVVVEDALVDDVIRGYICFDTYLNKNECILPKRPKKKMRKNRKSSTPEEMAKFAESVNKVARKINSSDNEERWRSCILEVEKHAYVHVKMHMTEAEKLKMLALK